MNGRRTAGARIARMIPRLLLALSFAASLSAPGDLRGRSITADTIRYVHDEITERGTSELAAAIEVR